MRRRGINPFELLIWLLVIACIAELIRGYWQILIALSVVVSLVYVVFKFGGKSESKAESTPEYEVRKSTPKLPPMPYSQAESKSLMPLEKRMALKNIPPEVRSLLWFADECNLSATKTIQTPFFDIKASGFEEPSLINKTLPIGEVLTPAPRLKYFPTYEDLTPDERATYLNWLRNVDEPIEIGYVFIFYYGLERKLLHPSIFNAAAEMILRLRKHHRNESFLAYSNAALMTMAAITKRYDLFERALVGSTYLSPLALAMLTYFEAGLNSDALMNLAGRVEFRNKRYIKNEPKLFREKLDETLTETCGAPFFPLSKDFLDDCPRVSETMFANVSLWIGEFSVPDVVQNVVFRATVQSILADAHGRVKEELKTLRKAGLR